MTSRESLSRQSDTARDRTCQECGMLLDDAGEFHPWAFCLMRKAGAIDPWNEFAWLCAAAGVIKSRDQLPPRPPLVRDLKAKVDSRAAL